MRPIRPPAAGSSCCSAAGSAPSSPAAASPESAAGAMDSPSSASQSSWPFLLPFFLGAIVVMMGGIGSECVRCGRRGGVGCGIRTRRRWCEETMGVGWVQGEKEAGSGIVGESRLIDGVGAKVLALLWVWGIFFDLPRFKFMGVACTGLGGLGGKQFGYLSLRHTQHQHQHQHLHQTYLAR